MTPESVLAIYRKQREVERKKNEAALVRQVEQLGYKVVREAADETPAAEDEPQKRQRRTRKRA